LVQGLTGEAGTVHGNGMLEYGTKVVAGVTPGKGGTTWESRKGVKVPVFNTVEEAVRKTGATASVVFVPGAAAADGVMEAAAAGIELVVCITEGIPIVDEMRLRAFLKETRARMIGPNCPGLITPGQTKLGIMPGYIHKPGDIGVVSRSGTLTYEAVWQLSALGLGQSTAVGIGGDPVQGTDFVDVLRLFNEDPGTRAVVLIGEIGGSMEEEAADWIARNMKKPVVAFIGGQTAPPGKRMGHAGAIIQGGRGTAAAKYEALRAAGVTCVESPADIGRTMKAVLDGRGK
ncbi:MAG: succinate--CoA ligase subunit alpha, partial [Planctomycetota bacterium]